MTMAEGVSMADPGYTLVIGDKNYSSWSLRPWLALKQCGVPFAEERIWLRQPDSKAEIFRHTPSGKVPALKTDVGVIWDSLAIVEYLAEQHPEVRLWPEDRETRAAARSVSAEMHSSFAALRNDMPMDLLSEIPAPPMSDALEANIKRVVAIWMDTRERFGKGGALLFGSFTIFADKPFHIGDWIKIGDFEGTVEEVGFRSTRVRRFDQAQVTVPNSQFIKNGVINYSAMKKRRIKFNLGVTYGTTASQMTEVVEGIKQIIKEDHRFDHNFYMVHFTDFGDFSLNIFVYCFTKTTVWDEYLTVREEFHLNIMQMLEEMGVEIAFPTQTVYVEKGM